MRSLLQTNPYLRDPKIRDILVREHAETSARIEGIRMKQRIITTEDRMRYTQFVSGTYMFSDQLTNFLYTLMRDHLTPGVVEKLVLQIEEEQTKQPITYTNGWLAAYSNYLALRLISTPDRETRKIAEVLSRTQGKVISNKSHKS